MTASFGAFGAKRKPRSLIVTVILTMSVCLGATSKSAAQGFISPLIGYDFGGDSGCAEISPCENKNLNLGVSFGSLGSVFGAEFEIAHARDFFGERPGLSSSVLTVMGNAMFAPRFGAAQPYVLAGLGLIKTHAELTLPGIVETDNNHLGWDIGGGLIVFLAPNVGVRGDIRHFHAFQDLELLGIPIADTKLDFGRFSGAVVFKF